MRRRSFLPLPSSFFPDTAYVRIYITDVNDNAPAFAQPVYEVSAEEDQEVGFVLITVTANDEDEGESLGVVLLMELCRRPPCSSSPPLFSFLSLISSSSSFLLTSLFQSPPSILFSSTFPPPPTSSLPLPLPPLCLVMSPPLVPPLLSSSSSASPPLHLVCFCSPLHSSSVLEIDRVTISPPSPPLHLAPYHISSSLLPLSFISSSFFSTPFPLRLVLFLMFHCFLFLLLLPPHFSPLFCFPYTPPFPFSFFSSSSYAPSPLSLLCLLLSPPCILLPLPLLYSSFLLIVFSLLLCLLFPPL